MSKELDYIADLERENRTIKSLLYCTKRSCNNCGKVNCENFQRQRIDCCGLWVSYKDYIAELENKSRLLGERCNQLLKDKGKLIDQIADIKANCDLAIEGRDIKIKELEKENTEPKSGCGMCYRKDKEQLIKAKDHIKTLLDCLKQDTNDPQTNYYVCQYMDKAEQFLKEIEK